MRHRRRSGGAGLPAILAALPLLVPAAAVAIRRPVIDWTGDRALTELAVREAARFHQLVGIGGRFGWRHPGPLWIQLLVPAYELTAHAPWSLTVGAMAVHIGCGAVAVLVAGNVGGRRAAAVMSAVVVAYIAVTGFVYWTNLWAGYAFTWPMLALVVVAAAATTRRQAGWAVPAALLLGTFLVQTDVSTIVPVTLVGAVAIGIRIYRHRFAGLGRPAAVALFVATGLAWVPPLVQQFSTNPGNLTLLWRYGTSGSGGYPLRTAAASVGAALSVVPLGSRWVLVNGVQARLGSGPWWAVTWTVAFVGLLVGAAILATRRRRAFAADLAIVTVAATVAAVVSISRVDGPINFYLLTWISILPIPGVTALVLALAPDGSTRWPTTAATAAAALLAGLLVVTHGKAHDWDKINSDAVRMQTARVEAAVGASARGLVRIHVVSTDAWPDAAGVALQLERRGAEIEVDPDWVFLFGDAFAPTADGRRIGTPTPLELWFAREHERPALTDQPQLIEIGAIGGVAVFARADLPPIPTV